MFIQRKFAGAQMAEIFGKKDGYCKGKGGSMHLIDTNVGFMGSTAIVAGTIPVGVGLSFSQKLKHSENITCIFFGDAAIEEGVLTVAHAGEEGPPEYIWEALDFLKVKRIDHGVQCLRDEKLVEKLSKSQIPLTVCPLSNIKLRVFKKLEDHNLKKMLDKKLMVMINSDDPAYFGGYLNKNLIEIQSALDLTNAEVKTLIINSFKSCLNTNFADLGLGNCHGRSILCKM